MAQAEELTVRMIPEMARELRALVESGEYSSISDAPCEAVRVWQRQRQGDDERLSAVRARIRRSLDDPRPDMTLHEVDAHLATLFDRAEQTGGDAAA